MLEEKYLSKNFVVKNKRIFNDKNEMVRGYNLISDLMSIFSLTIGESKSIVMTWMLDNGFDVTGLKNLFSEFEVIIKSTDRDFYFGADTFNVRYPENDYISMDSNGRKQRILSRTSTPSFELITSSGDIEIASFKKLMERSLCTNDKLKVLVYRENDLTHEFIGTMITSYSMNVNYEDRDLKDYDIKLEFISDFFNWIKPD